jgi:PAS domain-containing protein
MLAENLKDIWYSQKNCQKNQICIKRSNIMHFEPQKANDCAYEELSCYKTEAEKENLDQQRLQDIVEYAPIGLVLIDKDGNFRQTNPKFREFIRI